MAAGRRDPREVWGASPAIRSEELRALVDDLQADLQALVQDLRRGPIAEAKAEVDRYLQELRREFLRCHRRLQVEVRTPEGRVGAPDALRRELSELAARFRTVVLSRSSRVQHSGWTPTVLAEAVNVAVETLPRVMVVPYEARTWSPQPSDGFVRAVRRRLVRLHRWIRRAVGGSEPQRIVEIRELARYHLVGSAGPQVEGLAALFVQAEVQLSGRSRQLIEAVARNLQALVSNVEQNDFPDMLDGIRVQLEDEFASIERDVHEILDDGAQRATAIFGDALRALKDDVPIVATFDLPSGRRRGAAVVPSAQRAAAELVTRMQAIRTEIAAGYALLALHLEFIGFRARVQIVMDTVLAELGADVRGRSKVQLERVKAAVDDVLGGLNTLDTARNGLDDAVRDTVRPLELVVEEAEGVARQLLEQLSAETSVAPLLEALSREAHGLTDRYRVPAARIPRAEWKLPASVGLAEVDFSDVVTGFVQREVAPELLEITHRAMNRVLPILDAFQDLERIVTFNAEAIDDQFDFSAPATAGEQLTEIIRATLHRSRDGLTERLAEIAHWDEDLVTDIRDTVRAKLDELRGRLAEGDITRARAVSRRAEPGFEWRGQIGGAAETVRRFGTRNGAWLRRRIGDHRIAKWRQWLGLAAAERPRPVDASQWQAPRRVSDLPVFYSRLFATQARWAGDVLNVPEHDVHRARDVLLTPGPGPKAVALIGADAAGRGALVGAVVRGSKSVRRIALSQPTSVGQLKASLAEVGSGALVQLSGLAWLFSTRPGGVEPLCHLLDLIVNEERRIGWLLEADELVWAYAASVSPLAEVFSTQVRIPALTAPELERAIVARHQLSGFALRFDGADEVAPVERGPVRDRYFRLLYEASGGLLQVALPMWLGTIGQVDEDNGVVTITRRPTSPVAALAQLPEDIWQTLFVVARQGWMDSSAMAFILQREPSAAEGHLAGLARLGLLERQGRDVYVIRRHLRGATLACLKKGGWIG